MSTEGTMITVFVAQGDEPRVGWVKGRARHEGLTVLSATNQRAGSISQDAADATVAIVLFGADADAANFITACGNAGFVGSVVSQAATLDEFTG